jgi:S1-C subfamily serine protease
VDEESVGARAGFELGDLILEMDGEPIPDKERLAQLMATKRWGDTVVVRVQRGEETVALEVAFRREPPADDDDTDGEESQ